MTWYYMNIKNPKTYRKHQDQGHIWTSDFAQSFSHVPLSRLLPGTHVGLIESF